MLYWISVIKSHIYGNDDVIRNGRRDLEKYHRISKVIFIFFFKYICAVYNQSVTNCSTLACPKKKLSIFIICMQNNSFHIIMIYTAIW